MSLIAAARANAQASGISVKQTASWIYGESLTFQVQASAPTNFVGAQLVIAIQNRPNPYQIPVPISPSAQVDVSHTIQVADLNLPPAAPISYYWEFNDQAGQLHRGEAANLLYLDNRVPWDWSTTTQGNITVLTDGQNQQLMTTVLEIAVQGQQSAAQILNTSNASDITILVYPDLAAMANSLRAHHLVVQDWVAAYSISQQQVIFVAVEEGPHLLPSLKRDIRHELIHLAIAAASGENAESIPGWLNEGLAIYNSGESDPGVETALDEAVNKRILLSMDTLCIASFADFPPRDAALAYAQSASMVDYIAVRFGEARFAGLVRAYAQDLRCDQGVEQTLGLSLTELESQWLRYLSAEATASEVQSGSIVSWLIGWAASVILAILFIAPQPPSPVEKSPVETRISLPPVPSDEP